LMFAAAGGHAAIVARLLSRRASVHVETDHGCTALTFAAECSPPDKSSIECLQLLVAARADLNKRSGKSYSTFLMERFGVDNPIGNAVCCMNHAEKMEVLLRLGYQVTLGNEFGVTPAWWAAKRGNGDLAKKLVDAKAGLMDIQLNEKSQAIHGFHGSRMLGKTLNRFLAAYPRQFEYDVVKMMLDAKYDPNTSWSDNRYTNRLNSEGDRKQHLVFLCGKDTRVRLHEDFSVLNLLVEYKLDVNHVLSTYLSVVTLGICAAEFYQPSVVHWMLDQKALVHGRPDGLRPFDGIHMIKKTIPRLHLENLSGGLYKAKMPVYEQNFFWMCIYLDNDIALSAYEDWVRMQVIE